MQKKVTSGLLILFLFVASCQAATWYISSSTGNDSHSGKDIDHPWASLVKVSGQRFHPGDTILLKRGDTWEGTLTIIGSGTPEKPITVSAYGEGKKPQIAPKALDAVCITVRGEGIAIKNLDLSNAMMGILLEHDNTFENDFFRIEDCDFRDMDDNWNSQPQKYNHVSAGICIKYFCPYTEENQPRSSEIDVIRDLAIRNCTFTNCNSGIWVGEIFSHCDPKTGFGSGRYVYINGANISNLKADNCSQIGYSFVFFKNATITNCDVSNTGYGLAPWGTCGSLIAYSSNVIFDGCDIYNISRGPQHYDGVGFDFEGVTENVTFRNAMIDNTEGCGIFVYNNIGNGPNLNMTIENCVVSRFGTNPPTLQGNTREGIVFHNVGTAANTGTVKNVVLNQSNPENAFLVGNHDQFTLEGIIQAKPVGLPEMITPSSWTGIEHPAIYAMDKSTQTYWMAATKTDPQWLTLNLGTPQHLTRLEYTFHIHARWYFVVEHSLDGQNWKIVEDRSAGVTGQEFAFNFTINAQYVRIRILPESQYPATCRNLMMYGF